MIELWKIQIEEEMIVKILGLVDDAKLEYIKNISAFIIVFIRILVKLFLKLLW